MSGQGEEDRLGISLVVADIGIVRAEDLRCFSCHGVVSRQCGQPTGH